MSSVIRTETLLSLSRYSTVVIFLALAIISPGRVHCATLIRTLFRTKTYAPFQFQRNMVVLAAASVLRDYTDDDDDLNALHKKPEEISRFYPIGTPGIPWTKAEDDEWKAQTKRQRSYQDEVVAKLQAFKDHSHLKLEQYGALSQDPLRYSLYVVSSKEFHKDRPTLLVTGGVHGYETSGVQGAILFLQDAIASSYWDKVNLVVAPCVSPWAYEHIQRWQADLLDPNRSFQQQGTTEESRALIAYLENKFSSSTTTTTITCHLDLHETTNTDATEFMPAKHAKAGVAYGGEEIPDGFYLVADDKNSQLDFQSAIIDNVKTVTHIAPPDDNGEIIEVPVTQEGVILVPAKDLGLCCSVTEATYKTTTEVYPDSPKVTDELCNQAQVAAIRGALDYILAKQEEVTT